MAEPKKIEMEIPPWPRGGLLCPQNLNIRDVANNLGNDRYTHDTRSESGDIRCVRQEEAFLEPSYVAWIVAYMDTIHDAKGTPLLIKESQAEIRAFPGEQFKFVELVKYRLNCPLTPGLYYCAQAAAFFKVMNKFRLVDHVNSDMLGNFLNDEGRLGAVVINEAFEVLKAEACSPGYRRKIAESERRCDEAFKSSSDYVNALFKKHSRLLVGRIDLGFDKVLLKQLNVQKVDTLFKAFKNRLRGTALGRKLVGYIWCLESTEERGYHYHMLLFFDGSKHQKHEHLVQEIGNQWVRSVERDQRGEATPLTAGSVCGKASFHNCNLTHYQSPFLGQINHDDPLLRDRLLKNIAYICKAEQLLGVKVSKGMRTMGRGELPQLKAVKSGRPRKAAPAPSTELQKPQS